MQPMDRKSIEMCGITEDYFNEVPTNTSRRNAPHDWVWWHDQCDQGCVRTYTERYSHKPDVLAASDPDKVAYLDSKMRELIAAGKRRDMTTERKILSELTDIMEDLHYNRPWTLG